MTGGCRNAKQSARALVLSSGFVFSVFFIFFALFIDLLTDQVQPLFRHGSRDGGLTVLRSANRPDVVLSLGVKEGCRGCFALTAVMDVREMCIIVHVGGARCVTWSIDRSIQIHARIT